MTLSNNLGGRSKSDQKLNDESHSWHGLLHRELRCRIDLKSQEYRSILNERCVLVTGAGGWIGSRLAKRLAESNIRKLVLLDSSEGALYEIDQALLESGSSAHAAILANVCDATAIDEVFEQHRPDVIYHTAALKHVPLMESNPFAVVETNTLGTFVLVEAARRYDCEQIVMVSTDKAVDPASLMGASKRMAELVVLGSKDDGAIRTRVVRFGNVLGSSGSVVPLFMRQIATGGPVTVSHPEARRFFMTTSDAVEALLDALSPTCPEGLLAVAMGGAIRIVDLVNFLITQSAKALTEHEPVERETMKAIATIFTALRPGDKMEESLISKHENYVGDATGLLREVFTPIPTQRDLEDGINSLASAVQRRDIGDLLQAVLRLVPEYRPGSLILEQVRVASASAVTP
jgi:FlaA1/EpsC-like NDP-sugar epimerase